MDANKMFDTIMRELNNQIISDTDGGEEQESFSFHEEADSDDIPPSLLRYFEASKSRAAVCEKLILEELEDFPPSHHTEDMMNFPSELDEDTMKLNEQAICDTENEENNPSADPLLRPARTETEALFTDVVSVCPNNEDEFMEIEKQLALEYEAEREKRRCEEMEKEEQRRRRERDFQEELQKIMEAEKLQQKELELMGKRAQEKLEQELLLQQELISNLQRRVEEERKMREEEQRRIKDEEHNRRREEEKHRIEAERRRMEEELRRKKEEERKIEEMKRKKEEEEKRRMEREEKRMREEEQRRMKEEEDERKKEEEKIKMESERRRMEEERKIEEMKLKKEEEERRRIEREEKRKREEEQRRMQDEEDKRKREKEKRKIEAERKRMEEEMRRKKEEERQKEELDRKNEEEEKQRMEMEEKRKMRAGEQKRMKDEEDKRRREEEKLKIEAERKRMEEERKKEEMKCKNEEEKRKREEERNKIILERKKLEDEIRMMKEEEERMKKEEEERIKREEEERRKKEEERKKIKEARKKMERKKRKLEEEMSLKKKEEEERKKKEVENMRIEEEMGIAKETEENKEETSKSREKETLKKTHEEMRRRDEREHGDVDEDLKLEEKKEVKEAVRTKEGENRITKEKPRLMEADERRKTEEERKTKEEEQRRRQVEELRQEDEEGYRKSEEEIKLKESKEGCKGCDVDNMKMEPENKTKDTERKLEEEEQKKRVQEEIRKREGAEKELKEEEVKENKKEVNKKTEEGGRLKEEESKTRMEQEKEARVEDELQEKRGENSLMGENKKKNKDKTENTSASQQEDSTTWTSSSSGLLHSESTTSPTSTETRPPQHDPEQNISPTSTDQTVDWEESPAPSTVSVFLPMCLPEHTERRRLSWMRDCIPWSRLSLRNRRKQKGSVRSRRGPRVAAEAGSLPPLCPDSLLQSTGWKSLQEVTTVTLEDLPGCNLSTLAQCTQLRSLTLRRCGLRSLDGIKQLPQLCYIDVQENDISFVDCENMTSLQVLHLSHNKLTSIHGLTGAENLDVLDLSYNLITRIAGLESVRRLQRLSVDHNQLISTKGLRDVYTLLRLNVSHNHLAGVEGLENNALLHTLDLRANSLTEPPTLNNHVLLRELHLDDNSISSLQGLTACWLPLMQHLSVAQNRITQLPSLSDSVSLANLDLRFNCMSEIQNVCESLEGCQFLQEVHLMGNPLQQERSWRSTLQKAVPGLRLIDDQQTDSALTPPAVQQVSSASGSFLMLCQAQLQQTHDLQRRHSRELSDASSSMDFLKASCRHFTEALQLAEDQRFAHEYGDTTVTDKHRATGQTAPEETPDVDHNSTEKHTEHTDMESTGKVPQVVPHRCSYRSFEEKSAAESRHDGFNTVTAGPKTGLTASKANSVSVHSTATKGKTTSSNRDMAPVSNHQDLDLKNTAAVVIQQLWRKYRQKCGNSSSSSTAEKGGGRGGDGGKPESGPSYINGSVVGKDYAATVIQAFWRGFTLRRRLTSALAAVTCPDSGEDDTFEEVDVDEFVFDEAALEKQWTLSISEDSPSRRYPVSEQPLSVKPPVHFPEPSQYILPPPAVWRPKQAWVSGEQVDSAGRRVSPESCNRSTSPASASVLSGLSERSEKILEEWGFTDSNTALQMLKRAQKMKPAKQRRRRDPSVRLAMFRNCNYQLGPVEARNRPTQHNRNYIKVGEAELGLQQAEKVERVKQERAQQWLHSQAAHSDRDSESVHFLPEISPDVLHGGRVQLVADPGYTEHLHHARGLWANNSLAAQPRKENNYPRRNFLGRARKEVPSPQKVTSAPSKKERISFRDNPVQLSGGWGGGKKRDKVYK